MKAIDPRDLSDIDLLLYVAFGPLPKRGWSNRFRPVLEVIAETVVFVGGIAVLFVLIWLLAPEGAGYPR